MNLDGIQNVVNDIWKLRSRVTSLLALDIDIYFKI
jgi:hypothetical protein